SDKTQLRVVDGVRISTRQRVIHLHCGDTCAVLTVRALTEREEGKQQPHDSKDTLSPHIITTCFTKRFLVTLDIFTWITTLPAWRSLPVCRRSYRDVARSALPLDDPLSLKCRGIIGRRFERPRLQIDGRWGA
ncbi:hypothetical protein KUCAC02_004861, partial [Chaenocephalus aceratus]